MSKTNSSELITGLVKKTNFRFPAGYAGHWAANQSGSMGMGPKINELIYRFATNAKHVYRCEGLSRPIYEINPQVTEQLCMRALAYVNQFMGENPKKQGRDLVLMDGTAWANVTPSETFGFDVMWICVFWKMDIPTVAIVTGPRKWMKAQTQWSLTVESSFQVTILKYDPRESEYDVTQKLRNAIFSSTNFRQLKDYGTPIVQAVEATIDQQNEYPIAAANYLDGVVWYVDRPHRHHHILQSKEFQDAMVGRNHDNVIQGFLTNHGNFVTRYRAMLMAIDNKMIVDTPEMSVQLTRHEQKAFRHEEAQMGGVLRETDAGWGGFRVAVCPLFSEDLF